MYSHEQLINAVRAAGHEGKTFSAKDVRVQLGFETRDKRELSRFRRRLRVFEKDAAEQLEKVGNNSYRLKPGAFEQSAQAVASACPPLEPVSAVLETAAPAVQLPEPNEQPAAPYSTSQQLPAASAGPAMPPTAARPVATVKSVNPVRRAKNVATALVSGAFAASAAVSGRARNLRERGRNLRERGRNLRAQLWSCLQAVPLKQHAIARLRGWAEGLRPLSGQVREQLQALRQRVSSTRRRAA